MKKVCFKCKEEKDIEEFYVHKKMKDGYLGKCKECTKKDIRNFNSENKNKVRERWRIRGRLPHRIAARKAYAKTEKGRKTTNAAKEKWKSKNKLKMTAYSIFWAAVRSGKIKKESCEICGETKNIEGHHEDYFKPLDVNWLCLKHHHDILRKKNEEERRKNGRGL